MRKNDISIKVLKKVLRPNGKLYYPFLVHFKEKFFSLNRFYAFIVQSNKEARFTLTRFFQKCCTEDILFIVYYCLNIVSFSYSCSVMLSTF